MKTLKTILILFFILKLQYTEAQKTEIDKNFFFLGTLSDYIGRSKCNCELDVVDYYYKYEISLLKYNYDNLKRDYPNLYIDSVKLCLKSESLTKVINEKYDFKYNDGFCSNKEDERGNPIDSCFVGILKKDLFKSKIEKTSYLIGAYTRYGIESKDGFCINIANSESTFSVFVNLLKDLDCTILKI